MVDLVLLEQRISSIDEAPLNEEESPLILFKKGWSKTPMIKSKIEEWKGSKEEKINTFLDFMNIHLIVPSEVNPFELIYNQSKSSLTPTLRLGKNSLLHKRRMNAC